MPKQPPLIPPEELAVVITYADGETDHAIIRDGVVDLGPDTIEKSMAWMVTWGRLWSTRKGRAR